MCFWHQNRYWAWTLGSGLRRQASAAQPGQIRTDVAAVMADRTTSLPTHYCLVASRQSPAVSKGEKDNGAGKTKLFFWYPCAMASRRGARVCFAGERKQAKDFHAI